MKRLLTSILVVLFVCNLLLAQKKTPSSTEYKISLSTGKSIYSLGEPVFVNVQYYNGSGNLWQLYRPDSSFYCSVNYRNRLWRTVERWNGHAFNKSMFINDNPDCLECGYATALTGEMI